ncbi:MAG TPA: isoleucine--tRNA ligase [Candidatus Saccharimonadales bacterium]|nr:isoleucine--tRNA ligase [Candidatus Saccharimonadales bacterium]
MKFKKGTRRKSLEYEKDLIAYWKKNKIFEKSVQNRPADAAYVFYDGPPFITGVPHHGTLLSSIVKDAIPRYYTMKGKRVERVWGWDCHGLPAEVFTEKKLGVKDKRDIGTKISLADYINAARDNMVQTGNEWEETIERIGRWVDFKGAYKTMDKEYMESIWWAFKRLYESGKIYEGEKVLLYCTRDATPISKAEVAMDNSYQEVTDPSVYVKFKLKGQDTSILAWTTTPWTLPANTAAAVNMAEQYVEVSVGGEKLILAEALMSNVLKDEKHNPLEYNVVRRLKGADLVGLDYEPIFEDQGKNAHKIWAADYVTLEEGTGIVHLAPAYGEEDYELAKAKDFPIVSIIDEYGFYTSGEWIGEQVWETNKTIAKALLERGVVWKIDYIRHSYPHCHRCGTRLMYRAHPSWFMDIVAQKTTMLEQNGDIYWFPEHIKHGRFPKTIESAPDWNISRDRFWATAMPVWKGIDKDGKELVKVVGSYEELKELSGVELEDYHRPWIDEVTFVIDGVEYRRIDKVLDGWFESGSMPFAQFHYPFENVEKFENNFPGDFIAEYVGQVRAWFYYLHAISVGLFGKNAFNHVIVTGTLAGNDGRKMSKSFGNYTDPIELVDKYSADAYRMLLLSAPILNGEDFALQDRDVADVSRKLAMIWNMYDFFTLYAEVDGWDSGLSGGELPEGLDDNGPANPLDEWIISRIHELIDTVEEHMRRYDMPNALKPIIPFIDDASNWYVRRSRKRFWKSSNDDDKLAAYKTLHYVLVQLSRVMAPFTPFLSDELYRNLTGGESVHLTDWPQAGHINELVLTKMSFVRNAITEGLSIRAAKGIKVRQPLSKIIIEGGPAFVPEMESQYVDILKEELNVKGVVFKPGKEQSLISLDTELSEELRKEGLMREVIRHIQQARKQADLQVDDRIALELESADEKLNSVLRDQALLSVIEQETLAHKAKTKGKMDFSTVVKIDGDMELTISLGRTK